MESLTATFFLRRETSADLLFRRPAEAPPHVDIVNVYRPEPEHEGIVVNQVLPLGAGILWLQPSIGPGTARKLALEHGLELIEGIDIVDAVRQLTG
jgi:predicted CoA-binding protein